eukprot:526055-Prymnesium_polylepis.1
MKTKHKRKPQGLKRDSARGARSCHKRCHGHRAAVARRHRAPLWLSICVAKEACECAVAAACTASQ